jgi:hypothetical protein
MAAVVVAHEQLEDRVVLLVLEVAEEEEMEE